MHIPLQIFGLGFLVLQFTTAEVLKDWKDITSDKDIKLKQGGTSSLIKALDDALNNVSVDEVVADANHEMTITGGKYKWPTKKDDNEFENESWYPQGISSSVDAGDAKYNMNHLFLVSWYAKKNEEKGVRISFINTSVSPPKYRQVLLVEPTGTSSKPSFKTVHVHAGGIAWYGNLLYVADTNNGVRIFDVDHIWKIEDCDGAGRKGSDFCAYGYRYVMPQVRRYTSSGDPKDHDYTYSCLALDRTSTPAAIVFGEYYHAADGDYSRTTRFDLDATSHLLKVNSDNIATASKVFLHGNHRVQGAITVNGRYYLSQSNGDDDSDIIGFTPGGGNAKVYDVLHYPGSEDLTYDKGTDTLWTLTEKTGGRYIIGTPVKEISS
ncbi:MAG: hypothetical protein Q9202_006937 [Teloschistes flavicans]